jgi:hypothetical protein
MDPTLIEGFSPRFLAIFPYVPSSSTRACYAQLRRHEHTRSPFMNSEWYVKGRSIGATEQMASHIVIGDIAYRDRRYYK